jgi:ATP-dependent DNA helicase RecG
MFLTQQKRLFPLPDYEISAERVIVTLTGKILDMNYTKILEEKPDLPLSDVFLLDRYYKQQKLTTQELESLKSKGLLGEEGKVIHIDLTKSSQAQSNDTYKQIILDYLKQHSIATREEIDNLLVDKLPSALTEVQKEKKIRNLLYNISKREGLIENI